MAEISNDKVSDMEIESGDRGISMRGCSISTDSKDNFLVMAIVVWRKDKGKPVDGKTCLSNVETDPILKSFSSLEISKKNLTGLLMILWIYSKESRNNSLGNDMFDRDVIVSNVFGNNKGSGRDDDNE